MMKMPVYLKNSGVKTGVADFICEGCGEHPETWHWPKGALYTFAEGRGTSCACGYYVYTPMPDLILNPEEIHRLSIRRREKLVITVPATDSRT